MSEKYYFRTIGPSWDEMCTEKCMITGFGIGSIKCQGCDNCTDHNSDETGDLQGPDWIKCKQLGKATGKGNPKREEG